MSVFDDARTHINRSLIESFFPGGEWRSDGDYWVRSPLRNDTKIGSFHISDTGLWKDFASDEGGALIDLLVAIHGYEKKDAAAEIVKRGGGVVRDNKPTKSNKPKIAPVIPIPDSARDALNIEIKSKWAVEHHGEIAAGWKYFTARGEWCFSVARFNNCPSGREKEVVPYYWGTDGRWHEGQAYKDARPLYNLPELLANPDLPVLVVEGEKCASKKVPGWVVVSWSSGTASVDKTDWSPLEGRDVTIWPDADHQYDKTGKLIEWWKQPGMKAAQAIENRLPGAKILDVEKYAEPHPGWDIADAIGEGIDPAAFIAQCPVIEHPEDSDEGPEQNQFFRCLGYDAERYWFLREGKRSPQSISFGTFNGSKIQELAPLAFWSMMGMVSDQGSVKVSVAQDWIIKLQESTGRFDPALLRGAGVWADADEIIVNDGRRIVTRQGKKIDYAEYKTAAHYLSSDVVFGDISGEAATTAEGFDLVELFMAQGWQRTAYAMAVLGWCLISPFGGILKWRPHIWVSGKKGTGKSWTMENLIAPLCGPFAYKGSGKDSEAGIRRSLRTDARPVVLDEMESMDRRSAEKVTSILTLARNASSDASGYITIAAPDGGTLQYRVRSCFCFASIAVPDRGAAVESRIIRTELKWMSGPKMKEKRDRSVDLTRRCMRDPGRFRRRMFRALPRILSDIEELRTGGMLDEIGDMRDVDQWAPILASVWALVSEDEIASEAGREWVAEQVKDIGKLKEEQIEDEDRVIEHILSAQIETDGKTRRTVAEILERATEAGKPATDSREDRDLLGRHGIALVRHGGNDALAIESRSDSIGRWLKDTPYEAGYDAMLKRHALCTTPGECTSVRMGARKVRARLFDWPRFKTQYFGEIGGEE